MWDVKDTLGLNLEWFSGGSETAGQLGAIVNAVAAIRAGLATHVLCFRTVWESTAQTAGRRASVICSGGGWVSPVDGAVRRGLGNQLGGPAGHPPFYEFGTTREQVAGLATTLRAHAALNPKAVLRDPMSVEDYLNARMISDPPCLFDCDSPVDGSTAVIVSAADTAPDLAVDPVRIEAMGSALHGRPYWDQYEQLASMAAHDASEVLWRNTTLTVKDVDIASYMTVFRF